MSKPYFDLHVTGVGYLGRAREVSVRRGEPFLALEVNALHGSAEQVEYTRFDCRVTGAEARAVIQRHLESINDRDRKVLAGFRLGDLYADLFTYRSGEKLGQTGVALKARLLRIQWLKIDGETVYRTEQEVRTEEPSVYLERMRQILATVTEASEVATTDDLDLYLPDEVPQFPVDDPDFGHKQAQLLASGYRLDSRDQVWRLSPGA
jgi:hypothetical protein